MRGVVVDARVRRAACGVPSAGQFTATEWVSGPKAPPDAGGQSKVGAKGDCRSVLQMSIRRNGLPFNKLAMAHTCAHMGHTRC